VVSQPGSKTLVADKPAPKPSFKLVPNASAPERAPVSRETPQPPAPGDEIAASPAGPAAIPSGIITDALRSGAEVPPPPQPEKAPERIGGDVKLPQLLHMVPPSYPLAAKRINLQGEVTVRASVDAAGKVVDARVVSGPALLQQAAVDAVRHWKYEPATLDGKPVPMQMVVKVKFRLN
jgi:protein TonB